MLFILGDTFQFVVATPPSTATTTEDPQSYRILL